MRSEALDITIESRKDSLWLILSGPFHNEQIPNINEKIAGLIEDGNRRLVIDLESVTEIGSDVVSMFVRILNRIRGKGGDLRLIYRNETVSTAFAPVRNLVAVYPDPQSLERSGLIANIRRRHILMSRKTGIRLSRPVALFLLFVLCGWFFSLLFIIHLQGNRIAEESAQLEELTEWKETAQIEIETLRERLRPLKQLGIVVDTATVTP